MQAVTHFVETRHCRVACADSGAQGPPVLLIHGNSASRAFFRKQLESELARRYRLIAMDLPGHGDSGDATDPEACYTVPGYAAAALEVLAALGAAGAAVVGWSLGGHVGLELAGRPAAIAGLLITGSPPFSSGAEGLAEAFAPHPLMGLIGKETLSEEEIATYAAALPAGDGAEALALATVRRTDGRARRCMAAAVRAARGHDQRRVAETSPVPLAVVNGAEDPFLNHDYFDRVRYANLWRGQVHRLPGAGHAPFWERPAEFNALLAAFLGDVLGSA